MCTNIGPSSGLAQGHTAGKPRIQPQSGNETAEPHGCTTVNTPVMLPTKEAPEEFFEATST